MLTLSTLIAADLLLLAACLFTFRQNVRLRGQVAGAFSLLAPENGSTLPPLLGEDWTGTPQAIVYGQDNRPTLVYTFSKNYPFCQENWRALRSLQGLAPRRVRFVYVDTDRDKFATQYLAESGIGQSVLLVNLSPGSAGAYGARAIPQILLVDKGGRIQWTHVGELAKADISRALSLIERQ